MNFKFNSRKIISFLLILTMMISTLAFNVMASTTFKFGSKETALSAGEYTLPVKLMNASNIANASMAGSCIAGGSLKVDEKGNATAYVDLQAVSVFGVTAFASDWKIYQEDNVSSSTVDATVEKTDSEGNVTQISFAVPNNTYDGVYLNMSVQAMGMSPDAFLSMDYANATKNVNPFAFGTSETVLQAGEYTLPVKLMNASNIANASMAGSCIAGGSLKVDEKGNATAYVDLQAVSVFGVTAFASDWKIYQEDNVSSSTVDATVEKTDSEGNVTQISFAVPNNTYDGIYLNMSVQAMGMYPDAFLSMDYANATKKVNKYNFGSAETELSAGEYTLPVKLMNASNIANASMAGSCIAGGSLKVDEKGNATAYVDLQAVSVFGVTAFASDWKIYQEDNVSSSTVDATVEKTDSEGNVTQISFAVPNNTYDGIYLNMSVQAMGMYPDAFLSMDYANATVKGNEVSDPVVTVSDCIVSENADGGKYAYGWTAEVQPNGNSLSQIVWKVFFKDKNSTKEFTENINISASETESSVFGLILSASQDKANSYGLPDHVQVTAEVK